MGRYYLHLRTIDQSLIEDLEGAELPSLQAAQEEARAGIRSIMADVIESSRDLDVAAIIIMDEQGLELDRVPLKAGLPTSLRRYLCEHDR